MKNWLITLLSVICVAGAAQLAADSAPGPERRRFPVWDVNAGGSGLLPPCGAGGGG